MVRKFIDKKQAVTFAVVRRSQRDTNVLHNTDSTSALSVDSSSDDDYELTHEDEHTDFRLLDDGKKEIARMERIRAKEERRRRKEEKALALGNTDKSPSVLVATSKGGYNPFDRNSTSLASLKGKTIEDARSMAANSVSSSDATPLGGFRQGFVQGQAGPSFNKNDSTTIPRANRQQTVLKLGKDRVSMPTSDKINELGLPNDGYDYNQHFSKPSTSGTVYQNGKLVKRENDIFSRQVELPLDVFGATDEADEMVRGSDAITIDPSFMDSEIYNALFGESVVVVEKGKSVKGQREYEELDDFFVMDANKEFLSDDENDVGDNEDGWMGRKKEFDYDEHIRMLINKSEQKEKGIVNFGAGVKTKMNPLAKMNEFEGARRRVGKKDRKDEAGEEEYDSDDSGYVDSQASSDYGEEEEEEEDGGEDQKKKKYTPPPTQAQLDAEKEFNLAMLEYDSDEIGSLEYDEDFEELESEGESGEEGELREDFNEEDWEEEEGGEEDEEGDDLPAFGKGEEHEYDPNLDCGEEEDEDDYDNPAAPRHSQIQSTPNDDDDDDMKSQKISTKHPSKSLTKKLHAELYESNSIAPSRVSNRTTKLDVQADLDIKLLLDNFIEKQDSGGFMKSESYMQKQKGGGGGGGGGSVVGGKGVSGGSGFNLLVKGRLTSSNLLEAGELEKLLSQLGVEENEEYLRAMDENENEKQEGQLRGEDGGLLVGGDYHPKDTTDKKGIIWRKILEEADEILAAGIHAPAEEDVLFDNKSYYDREERNAWDCESILSTYSNLDNRPAVVEHKRKKQLKKRSVLSIPEEVEGGEDKEKDRDKEPIREVMLSRKTGMPLGVLDEKAKKERIMGGVNKGVPRKKGETAEEKKARKSGVKEERVGRRNEKKEMAGRVGDEIVKRRGTGGGEKGDVTKGSVVFRY